MASPAQRRRPIVQHLLLLVVVATAPFLALVVFDLHERVQQTTDHTEETLLDAASRTAFDAEHFTRLTQVMLSGLAARPLVRALDPGRCDPELGHSLAFVPEHANLLTFAADGRLLCAAVAPRADGRRPLVDPSHFLEQAGRTRSFTVGALERDGAADKWLVSMVQPIVDDQGQFQGAVAVAVDLLTFSKTRNAGTSHPQVITGIIDANGSLIGRSMQPEQWLGKSSKGLASARDAALSRQARAVKGTGADGVERMFSFAPIRGTDWTAFAAVALDDVYASQWRSAAVSGALALFITALAAALSIWMTRRISGPIKAIAEAAKQAGQGRWSVPVGPAWPTEVADVAVELDQALAQRLAAQTALRDSKEDLGATLDAIADGVIAADLSGRITGMNPAAERLTGWNSLQARGQPLVQVFGCIDPVTREPVTNPVQRMLSAAHGAAVADGAILLARDGREFRIAQTAAPIRTASGQVRGLVLVFSDVTALHAEQLAHARDAELLRQAGSLAKIGGWQLELATMQVTWSEGLYRIHGLDPNGGVMFGRGLEFVAPESRPVIQEAMRAGMAHGTPWDIELPLLPAADGRPQWVRSQGTALMQGGKVVRLTGAVQDITERKQMEQRLRDSEARYRELFQANPHPMWVYELQTRRFLLVNDAALSHYGYSEREFLSMTILDIRPPEDVQRLLAASVTWPERGYFEAKSWRHLKKDGSIIEVEISSHSLQFGDRPARVVLAHDVTDRNRALRELDEQRQRMMAIIDSAMDGIISVDQDERIVIFNAAAETMFGCSASEVLGHALDRFIPQRHRAVHHEKMREFGATGKSSRHMGQSGVSGALCTTALRADGQEFPIEASISSSVVFGQTYHTVVLRDVTERVQAARALMDQQLELSALAHRLMTTEEQTNRALAQTLHDQLGQTLSALRLSFDAFEGALPREAMAVTEHWRARLSDLIDRSVVEVRQVLVDLRPALLEEMGLAAAIENELSNQAQIAGDLEIVFAPGGGVDAHRWPDAVEHAAFMVAREAVANAVLHSGASRIDVQLTHGLPDLQLTVHDNGRGLALERRRSRPGHLGMVGMRERAVAIGGQLRVQSFPGEGTTVTLRWSPEA